MLETILYIYLSGWIGFGSYGSYQCHTNEQHSLSKGQCHAITWVGAGAWPVGLGVSWYFSKGHH